MNPPPTALSSVTVKVMSSPSSALAFAILTTAGVSSSSRIVPVALEVAVTLAEVPDTLSLTLKVSSDSSSESSVVVTVKVRVSPLVPEKEIPLVFSV